MMDRYKTVDGAIEGILGKKALQALLSEQTVVSAPPPMMMCLFMYG